MPFFYKDPAAPKPTGPRRIGVAALIERDGCLLLDRRVDAPVWALVAGALEDDESLTDALRREVAEETGLDIAAYSLFGTFSDPSRIVQYPDGNVFAFVTMAYTVEARGWDSLRASWESESLELFPLAEIPRLTRAETHRPIIERYLSGESQPFLD